MPLPLLLRLSLKPTQHFYMVPTMDTPTIWDTVTVPTMGSTMDFMPVPLMVMDFPDTATLMLTVSTNVRLRLILKSLPLHPLHLMSMATLLFHMSLPLQPLPVSPLLSTTQVRFIIKLLLYRLSSKKMDPLSDKYIPFLTFSQAVFESCFVFGGSTQWLSIS